ALAEAEVTLVDQHAHLAAEVAVSVCDQPDMLDVLVASPRLHDEAVVDGDADHLVDAGAAERGHELLVAGQMAGRARRRECARQRENDDGAAAEQLAGGHVLPFAALAGAERDVGYSLVFSIGQHRCCSPWEGYWTGRQH